MLNSITRWLLYVMLSFQFGAASYFSFFAANELFGNLPEDTAGKAVGILFPTFFRLCTYSAIAVLALYWVMGRHLVAAPKSYRIGMVLQACSFVMFAFNLWVMLPRVQQIEEQMGPLSKASPADLQRFGMTHGISMLIDFLSILCTAAVWFCLAMNDSTVRRSQE